MQRVKRHMGVVLAQAMGLGPETLLRTIGATSTQTVTHSHPGHQAPVHIAVQQGQGHLTVQLLQSKEFLLLKRPGLRVQ